jgi:hypothetical protein
LTLRELEEFPWGQKWRRCTGYVDAKQYAVFRADGQPDEC